MPDDSGLVTLEDVATDRQRLAEAHRRVNARRPFEWLLGGSLFTMVFGVITWFLNPATPLGIYVIIAIVSFATGGFAVLMNMKEQTKWRMAKEGELDSIERKIRAGERVPRPNTSFQGTRRHKSASRP
jgi:hypothetical protein